MKRIKIIEPKPMQIKLKREFHDTDNDGIANFADCNIWNPHEQGFFHDKIASTYTALRKKAVNRRKRIYRENKKDTSEPLYQPPTLQKGRINDISSYNEKQLPSRSMARKTRTTGYGKRIASGVKKVAKGTVKGVKTGVGYAKDVVDEAHEMQRRIDEEYRKPTQFEVFVYTPVYNESGVVVGHNWTSLGETYTEEQARSTYVDLSTRGYTVTVKPKKFDRKEQWKENVKSGIRKPQQGVEMAHIMFHQAPQQRRR